MNTPGPSRTTVAADAAAGSATLDAHELIGQMGSEVAAALSSALERVNALATTGKISRRGLRELRERIELARRVGIMGQQVHRLAAGRIQQSVERVDLTAAVREALVQHRRQIESLGVEVRQVLGPAQVMADPTLIFMLVETLLEWAFQHARGAIDLHIELNPWPVFARLTCSFGCLTDEQLDGPALHFEAPALRAMSWRLLQQVATTMDLPIDLQDDGARALLSIEFPRTVNDPGEMSALRDRADSRQQGLNSKPLAGSHLLVLAARRETRALVRDAIRHMGLMVDYVTSVDEAREFCAAGMPHAVLYESPLAGERLERLRRELLGETPHLVFVELSDDVQGLQTRQVGQRHFSCVGRDSIVESLPAALMFELSRPR